MMLPFHEKAGARQDQITIFVFLDWLIEGFWMSAGAVQAAPRASR